MVEPRRDVRLAQEPLAHLVGDQRFGPGHLECHVPRKFRVMRQKHDAAATASQFADDGKAPDPLPVADDRRVHVRPREGAVGSGVGTERPGQPRQLEPIDASLQLSKISRLIRIARGGRGGCAGRRFAGQLFVVRQERQSKLVGQRVTVWSVHRTSALVAAA
jgi:hypothetical protein